MTPVEVDIPQDDLSFFGCAAKSVVKIRPTKNCLVAISEFPFFVLDFDEI
jgi:nucleosome binding factor SPN SPT16 subunit